MSPGPNNGTEGSLYHLLRHEPPLPVIDSAEYTDCDYPVDNSDYTRRSDLDGPGCQCDVTGLPVSSPFLTFFLQYAIARINMPTSCAAKGSVNSFFFSFDVLNKSRLWLP